MEISFNCSNNVQYTPFPSSPNYRVHFYLDFDKESLKRALFHTLHLPGAKSHLPFCIWTHNGTKIRLFATIMVKTGPLYIHISIFIMCIARWLHINASLTFPVNIFIFKLRRLSNADIFAIHNYNCHWKRINLMPMSLGFTYFLIENGNIINRFAFCQNFSITSATVYDTVFWWISVISPTLFCYPGQLHNAKTLSFCGTIIISRHVSHYSPRQRSVWLTNERFLKSVDDVLDAFLERFSAYILFRNAIITTHVKSTLKSALKVLLEKLSFSYLFLFIEVFAYGAAHANIFVTYFKSFSSLIWRKSVWYVLVRTLFQPYGQMFTAVPDQMKYVE